MSLSTVSCENKKTIVAVDDPLDEAVREVFGSPQDSQGIDDDVDLFQLMLSEPDFGVPITQSQAVPDSSPVPKIQRRPAMVSIGSMSSFRRACESTSSMSSLQSSSIRSTTSRRSTNSKGSSGKPKRALSAYNIYFTTERKKLTTSQAKEGSPKLTFKQIACKIAGMWKKISQEEKMEYEYLAAQDTERYENEMVEWKASQESLVSLQQPASSYHHQESHIQYQGNASWSQDHNLQHLRIRQNNIFF